MKKNKNSNPFVIQSGKFKDGQVNKFNRYSWSEDVFVFEKKEKEIIGNNFEQGKLKIVAVFFTFLLLILLGKSAWLQIVKGDDYYLAAETNRVRTERIEPKRGVIYDRFRRPLVRNRPNFMLYFIPADISVNSDERDLIFNELDLILENLSINDLYEKYNSVKQKSLESYRPLFVTDNIPYEKAMELYLLSDAWSGVVLSNRTNRDYIVYGLKNENEQDNYFFSMSHIMGYTGKINKEELEKFGEEYLPIDYIGKMGIEYFWENELKGKSGYKQIEVDALRREKKILMN